MFTPVSFNIFCEWFENHNRMANFNNSYENLRVLFEHLEQLEEETGIEAELDVIAICCEWACSTLAELEAEYSQEIESLDDAVELLTGKGSAIVLSCEETESLIYLQDF